MRTIRYFYDLVSPYAFLVQARFGDLPADCAISPVPVLFGAILKHHGNLGPAELPFKRRHLYRQTTHLGEHLGLPIRYPERHPFNSLGAMRVLAGANADREMVARAFDFVFGQARTTDLDGELDAFCDWLGLDPALAGDPAAKAALRQSTDAAITAGVFGVPSFVAEGDRDANVFFGVDAFDMLLDFLADTDLFKRENYARLDAIKPGVERKV